MLLTVASLFCARADGWNYWGQVYVNYNPYATISFSTRLATDGTNLFYSTVLDGVYRAALADQQFSPMPMTGFPLWDGAVNTNGYAVQNLAVTPQGTLVISGSPVNVISNGISPPPNSFTNPLPVFYWWDETNQLWHAASVINKSYPYTANVGNFSVAPDGSLWACSGYYPYAYRSTNNGHSYTAFDINAAAITKLFSNPISPPTSPAWVRFLVLSPVGTTGSCPSVRNPVVFAPTGTTTDRAGPASTQVSPTRIR